MYVVFRSTYAQLRVYVVAGVAPTCVSLVFRARLSNVVIVMTECVCPYCTVVGMSNINPLLQKNAKVKPLKLPKAKLGVVK